MHPLNPFLYGKPVPPTRFIGRRDVLQTVFSRLHHGDSTALLGLPHFGKSSVLRYLESPKVRTDWLGRAAEAMEVVPVDCHGLPASAQPVDFWRSLVQAVLAAWDDDTAVRQAATAAERALFTPQSMTRLFRQAMGAHERRVALLLDEVEVLLYHPNFCRPEFLGLLRSLTTNTDGLVLILASRMSLTQMNRLSAPVNHGSPFFNNVIEVPLTPLSVSECQQLLDTALAGLTASFQKEDCAFVIAQSGGQPYLVQAAAAALFELVAAGAPAGLLRYQRAARALHQQVGNYFDALWQHLDGRLRQALLLEVLMRAETAGKPARDELGTYTTERQRLRQLGLLVPSQGPGSPGARDGEEAIATALSTWLLEYAAATARHPSPSLWEDWLAAAPEAQHEAAFLRVWAQKLSARAGRISVPVLLPDSPTQASGRDSHGPTSPPTRASLRQLLQSMLRTAAELDRFCLDYFKDAVYVRFSDGMNRTLRLNLLLESVDAADIVERLRTDAPQEYAKKQHLLRYE